MGGCEARCSVSLGESPSSLRLPRAQAVRGAVDSRLWTVLNGLRKQEGCFLGIVCARNLLDSERQRQIDKVGQHQEMPLDGQPGLEGLLVPGTDVALVWSGQG